MTKVVVEGVGIIESKQDALEALSMIRRNQGGRGTEEGDHRDADAILCALLHVLGYGDVVQEYAQIEKWYA